MNEIKFLCPYCRQKLEAEPEMRGDLLECPSCTRKIRVPAAMSGQPPTAPRVAATSIAPGGPPREPAAIKPAPPCDYKAEGLDMAGFFDLMAGERVVATYYARKRVPKFRVLVFLVLLLMYIIPGILYVLWYFGAKREHGLIAITNRRLLWLEYGKGWGERCQRQISLNLHMIAAVELYTQHGISRLLGLLISEKKAFLLKVLGRYPITWTVGGLAKISALTGGSTSTYEPADNSLELVQNIGSMILELQRKTSEGMV